MENTKAYAAIVDYILQFGVSRIYENSESEYPRTSGGSVGFVSTGFSGSDSAKIGDLICLESARQSPWRLSWLREARAERGGDTSYLCESVQDGTLCWWSNVGVSYFHRSTLEKHPEWRWTDEQYAFNEKWMKACKRHDPYLYRPLWADFAEDGTPTIGTRSRFDFDGFRATGTVPNWKKITQKALADMYLAFVAEHKAQPKKESKPC